MKKYIKTIWKNSPETEINADRLNNIEDGIEALYDERSHVGMVIHSTKLDTMEKVIELYGGSLWEKIEGRFLLGDSETHNVGDFGGESEHTLTVEEMPIHNHGMNFSTSTGTYASSPLGDGGKEWGYSTNTISNTGGSQPHNNMPPYKVVYIWERIE